MEANTRSPIFTGFSELLEGIVTVRAFGVEKRFLNEMYSKVDLTTRVSPTLGIYRRHMNNLTDWIQVSVFVA